MRTGKKLLFLLFLIACMGILMLCASAESKSATFLVGDTVVFTDTTDERGAMPLPGAPDTDTGVFVGWVLEAEGGGRLYAPGAAFRDEGTQSALTFRALTVRLNTLTGAAAGLSLPYSLRFDATLAGEDYRTLLSLAGAENVTVGILTAPYEKIIGKGENFNPEDGKDFVTLHAAAPGDTTAETLFFSARVGGISEKGLLNKFAARAFVSVRFADGTERVATAPFVNGDHARSVHAVLSAALEDAADRAGGRYTDPFSFEDASFYSPYSAKERSFLQNAMDCVISVQLPVEDGEKIRIVSEYSPDGIHFKPFRFYTSPYTVSKVNYGEKTATVTVTAKGGANVRDIATYYLGGSYSSAHPDNLFVSGDEVTFTFRTDTGIG